MKLYEGYYNELLTIEDVKKLLGESTFIGRLDGYLLADGTYIYDARDRFMTLSDENKGYMNPDIFMGLGNIELQNHHIIIEKCPTDEQYNELRRIIRFYHNDKLTVEFVKDLQDNITVTFDMPVVEIVLSQIIRYFNENVTPTGYNRYDSYHNLNIDYIIVNEHITYKEALKKHQLNEDMLDSHYDFDSVYQEIDFKHILSLLESGGIVRRFDNIFDSIVSLIYNNYYVSEELLDTGYSYYSIIKRYPDESEEDYINRCCDKSENHQNQKDWHPIFISMRDIDSSGSVTRKTVWNYYIKNKKHSIVSSENDDMSVFDSDPIIININPEKVAHSEKDIARTLQHEFTHSVDLYNGNNSHLFQKKCFISNITDIFNIRIFNNSLYKIIEDVCYLLAPGEQVAFINGLDRDLQYRVKQPQSPDELIKETSDISCLMSMKYYWNILNRNDENIVNGKNSKYVWINEESENRYNIIMVMLFITLGYYFKIHEQDGFKNSSISLLNHNFIERVYKRLNDIAMKERRHSPVNIDKLCNEYEDIKLSDFYINENEYLLVKEKVLGFIENNFNDYAENVEYCIENVLIKKGFMTEKDKIRYQMRDKKMFT